MERTFFMIKPDGVRRCLCGEILSRIERKGLTPVGIKLMCLSQSMAETHYAEHKGKPFFKDLVAFITGGPVLAMVLEGDDAVAQVRNMMGKTDPADSPCGTIRGDFATTVSQNVVHGSDSLASAEREIALFFEESELIPPKAMNRK